jgi:formiminoglutamase
MLTPPQLPELPPSRPDDPRLNEVFGRGSLDGRALQPGQPVLLGFPVDEGIRRNGGRVGAAGAPDAIRGWLYRLAPTDAHLGLDIRSLSPVDLGDLAPALSLEESQAKLGAIVGEILKVGAIPIILGGGHETAYGHFLGYCHAGLRPAIINFDAHLDIRVPVGGLGNSGTPFRQAMDHETAPLEPGRYACLGIQPRTTSVAHWQFCQERGDLLAVAETLRGNLAAQFDRVCAQLGQSGSPIYVTVDADVVSAADVPGVSAPNSSGLAGHELLVCARNAGRNPRVRSFDLVEINPKLDSDSRSSRWAATMVWHFLIGLSARPKTAAESEPG